MNEGRARTRLSRLICFALRHSPTSVGIALDPDGFANVAELATALRSRIPSVSEGDIVDAASHSQTDRYELREGKLRILYGHSPQVPIRRTPAPPPPTLYHATDSALVERILQQGLLALARSHVHLTTDVTYARAAAVTQGRPALLVVDALAAARAAVAFYQASNIVWLTEHVPAPFLRLSSEESHRRAGACRAQIREVFVSENEEP